MKTLALLLVATALTGSVAACSSVAPSNECSGFASECVDARTIRRCASPSDYLDFRSAILSGELADYTCLLGTLVQETYSTHPHIRTACEHALASHIDALTRGTSRPRRAGTEPSRGRSR